MKHLRLNKTSQESPDQHRVDSQTNLESNLSTQGNWAKSPPCPEWLQLPKPPARCPVSSLSRSKLNELLLPCKANGYKPLVRSVSLKSSKFATRGVRLYSVSSLLEFLESCETTAE